MKEFITDLLTKVNNAINFKIEGNNSLIINNTFNDVYDSNTKTYNLSENFIPIYHNSTLNTNDTNINSSNTILPSWCREVYPSINDEITINRADTTYSFPFTIQSTFQITKTGVYLIEYEMPNIMNITATTPTPANIYMYQVHFKPDKTIIATGGNLTISGNSSNNIDWLNRFLQSRKRDVFYLENGSYLGGLFCFIFPTNSATPTTLTFDSGGFWSRDYSFTKITPVNYHY